MIRSVYAFVLALVILGASAAPVAAQASAPPPRLVGFVRDSLAPAPVRNAEVRVAGTRIATLTDAEGRFELEPPPGAYVLEVGALGYQTVRMALTGAPSEPIRLALAPVDRQRLEDCEDVLLDRELAEDRRLLRQIPDAPPRAAGSPRAARSSRPETSRAPVRTLPSFDSLRLRRSSRAVTCSTPKPPSAVRRTLRMRTVVAQCPHDETARTLAADA